MLTPSAAYTKESRNNDPSTTTSKQRRLSTVCDGSNSSNFELADDSQVVAQRQVVLKPRTPSDGLLPAATQQWGGAIAGTLGREQQTRILFVTLLESYLRTYDDDPLRNRRLFFAICRTLYSMGIVGKEYVDEMAT
ncbi:hypothetical protein GGI00_000710, partial [Coemansia sp. RSA 2681]